MSDSLAPPVTEEQSAAAAELDAMIDGGDFEQEQQPEQRQEQEPTERAEEAPEAPERDFEAEARDMGWKPADEWSGDPAKHRDAKTFVELADNDPAVLRQKYDAKVKEVEDFKGRVTAITKEQVERAKRDAEDRHRAEIASLEQERDDLIEEYQGDAKSIKQINKNFEAAKADIAKPDDEVAAVTVRTSWLEQRPAYNTDPLFMASARMAMETVMAAETQEDWAKTPQQQQEARFAKVDDMLAKSGRFNDVYGDTPAAKAGVPKGAPPANSRSIDGSRSAPGRPNKGYDSLPADAKSMFNMLKDDLGADAPSKEDYAKGWHNA